MDFMCTVYFTVYIMKKKLYKSNKSFNSSTSKYIVTS